MPALAELAVVPLDRALHRRRARERVGRARVRHHQRVADGLHLGAAGRGDGLAQRREVVAAQLVGRDVAELRRQLGRAHEIREQDRDQALKLSQNSPAPPSKRTQEAGGLAPEASSRARRRAAPRPRTWPNAGSRQGFRDGGTGIAWCEHAGSRADSRAVTRAAVAQNDEGPRISAHVPDHADGRERLHLLAGCCSKRTGKPVAGVPDASSTTARRSRDVREREHLGAAQRGRGGHTGGEQLVDELVAARADESPRRCGPAARPVAACVRGSRGRAHRRARARRTAARQK